MAFSTNLRGLRSIAMAVLISDASNTNNTNALAIAGKPTTGKLKNISGRIAGFIQPNKN